MGHWFTNAGPSAQFVPFWKKPCQCCERDVRTQNPPKTMASIRTILVDFSIVWFVIESTTFS